MVETIILFTDGVALVEIVAVGLDVPVAVALVVIVPVPVALVVIVPVPVALVVIVPVPLAVELGLEENVAKFVLNANSPDRVGIALVEIVAVGLDVPVAVALVVIVPVPVALVVIVPVAVALVVIVPVPLLVPDDELRKESIIEAELETEVVPVGVAVDDPE